MLISAMGESTPSNDILGIGFLPSLSFAFLGNGLIFRQALFPG